MIVSDDPVPNTSLEKDFADTVLDKFTDFYRVCDNHCKHDRSSETNEWPMLKFDWHWDIAKDNLPELPDDDNYGLETRLQEQFYEELNEDEWIRESIGVPVFTDMNRYRMLAKIPIKDLEEHREELSQEINQLTAELEDDDADPYIQEDIDEKMEEIKEVDGELVGCAGQLQAFLDWFENFKKGWQEVYKEYVVVVDADDDTNFDCIPGEWFVDMRDENNWLEWTPDGVIDHRTPGQMPGQTKMPEFIPEQQTLKQFGGDNHAIVLS